MNAFQYECQGLENLPAVAKQLLNDSNGQRIFALYGNMGSGKTTLVKEMCNILGVKDIVTSPSYTILNEYYSLASPTIFHFDFYRIKSESEAYDFGYEEYFYSENYCFIEWPEKIPTLIPQKHARVFIETSGTGRTIKLTYE